MTVEAIITSPSFIKIRTVGGEERYINSNLVEEISPHQDDKNMSDIFMMSGKIHTIKETASQLVGNRYQRDASKGATIINFIG